METERFPGEDPFAAADDHVSRRLLCRALRDRGDAAAWDGLVDTYDAMADGWMEWAATIPQYTAPLAAALRRVPRARHALEICCGPGTATALVAEHADRVTATDASSEMIAHAPRVARAAFQVADVRRLPFADGCFDLVVGLNAVPEGSELDRVCAADGALIWATSFGADTPIYVGSEEIVRLLGPEWTAIAGRVGRGEWCVCRKRRT